ncbi:MAG: PASTA domain-containing protein [Gaiellaceae bacterium]
MHRVTFYLPWLAVAAALAILSTAALSLAGSSPPQAEPEIVDTAELLPPEEPLMVPDVRFQPYVFAKGILEDAGFAWRVKGGAKGFPANVVVTQKPAPGTLLRDTGAPTVVLALERNTDYEQRGLAKNKSPYKGTKNVRWNDEPVEPVPPPGEEEPSAPEPPAEEAPAAEPAPAPAEPVEPAPVEPPDASSEESSSRPPAFIVPGAPPEPPNEIPLVARVENLAAKLAGETQTDELVDHWLFQHEWVVTGAEFGWAEGEEALVKLIELDNDLQARWGIGAKSAEVAQKALDGVRAELAEVAQSS